MKSCNMGRKELFDLCLVAGSLRKAAEKLGTNTKTVLGWLEDMELPTDIDDRIEELKRSEVSMDGYVLFAGEVIQSAIHDIIKEDKDDMPSAKSFLLGVGMFKENLKFWCSVSGVSHTEVTTFTQKLIKKQNDLIMQGVAQAERARELKELMKTGLGKRL